jgi:hypothetical protein
VDDVVEQEEQDPGRGRAQRALQPNADVPDPADRQADQDRRAGDGSEDEDLRGRQVRLSFWLV